MEVRYKENMYEFRLKGRLSEFIKHFLTDMTFRVRKRSTLSDINKQVYQKAVFDQQPCLELE